MLPLWPLSFWSFLLWSFVFEDFVKSKALKKLWYLKWHMRLLFKFFYYWSCLWFQLSWFKCYNWSQGLRGLEGRSVSLLGWCKLRAGDQHIWTKLFFLTAVWLLQSSFWTMDFWGLKASFGDRKTWDLSSDFAEIWSMVCQGS